MDMQVTSHLTGGPKMTAAEVQRERDRMLTKADRYAAAYSQGTSKIMGNKVHSMILDDSSFWGDHTSEWILPEPKRLWFRAMPKPWREPYAAMKDDEKAAYEAELQRIAEIPGARYLKAKQARRTIAKRVAAEIESRDEIKHSHDDQMDMYGNFAARVGKSMTGRSSSLSVQYPRAFAKLAVYRNLKKNFTG